jgi:NAD(P)-dependent dehydrogenase (short-subunit alcohol dehydrogenase family)
MPSHKRSKTRLTTIAVLIGSIAGDIDTKGYGVYAATKAAVRSFLHVWANKLAPKDIRVTVVSPGPTDTDNGVDFARCSRRAFQHDPLRRKGRPDEVAAAALFLASSESSFTSRAELVGDGGMAADLTPRPKAQNTDHNIRHRRYDTSNLENNAIRGTGIPLSFFIRS